jgi:L-aspartate oxidase
MPRQVDNVIHVPGALILGAGLAGLFTALKLAPFPACIVAGARAGTTGSSVWAQGGRRRRNDRSRSSINRGERSARAHR